MSLKKTLERTEKTLSQTTISKQQARNVVQINKVTKKILSELEPMDTIRVQNILCLGDSADEIVKVLEDLFQHQINLCMIEENLSFKAEDLSEVESLFKMVLKLHRSLISIKSKRALQGRKASGKKLGRPFYSESAVSLENYKDEILSLISSGMPKREIAEKYNVCRTTIYGFLKRVGAM